MLTCPSGQQNPAGFRFPARALTGELVATVRGAPPNFKPRRAFEDAPGRSRTTCERAEQLAKAFFRSVGATRHIAEAEALLSAPVESRTSAGQ